MRKLLFAILASATFFAACKKTDAPENREHEIITSKFDRSCAAYEILQEELAADPERRKRYIEIEQFTQRQLRSGKTEQKVSIEIPVIVHVLYNAPVENISNAQINSQIDVLNEDFNNDNADASLVPNEFRDEQTSVGITFVLDRVIRKFSPKKKWQKDDMKRSSKGGSDPIDPGNYLNIWVVNEIAYKNFGILGFSSFPGENPAVDGVVIGYLFFGSTGTLEAPYNKGRTATHEVGHWMNLHHIWGDAVCGDDFIADTPLHNAPNFGCPTYPHKSTCTGTPNEMTMNYMDYTQDACMFMFTNGQRDRMLAVFAEGGPRSGFVQ